MTTEIAALEARAGKAAAVLQAAQDAADQARRQEADRQAARARRIAEDVLAGYNDAALAQEVQAAQERLAQVIADSDIGQAWIAVQLAGLRHAHASVDYNDAAGQLGRPANAPARPASEVDLTLLARLIDRTASERLYAELEERDAARRAHIEAVD